ncbi:hypothetical protein Taro_047677 [Colocasia esculenta]|uniref:Uncharacterized protein n=1 Tax=Colocasia esculenta TaxID=4460 RepID=A0A843WW29_COLES|nr:hypothetical protein [Colocasia esculenta]
MWHLRPIFYPFVHAGCTKNECSEGYLDFLTGAWFNREEVDKFDEKVRLFLAGNKDNVTSKVDLSDMKEEEMEEEQKPVKTTSSRNHGYTTCHHVYVMEEGRRICVAWNDIGQLVGPGYFRILEAGDRGSSICTKIVPCWESYLSIRISMIPLRGGKKRRRMGSEENDSSSEEDESSERRRRRRMNEQM